MIDVSIKFSGSKKEPLVVLKSFFDAGNKADNGQYKVLSLAVVSGTEDEWDPFDDDWREMLVRHHADSLHTTDAVSRQNDFDGWTEKEVDSFLRDCIRVIERHFLVLNEEHLPGRFGLYCFVVSIVLKDFVEYARNNPDAIQDANQGCFRQALGDLGEWAQAPFANCEHVQCFFDQGEPFYGFLVNLKNSKQAPKQATFLNKIVAQTEVSSRRFPSLQMADLFAWVQSHRQESWNPDWKKRIMRLPYRWDWLDSTNLNLAIPHSIKSWEDWKIPKRAATK